MSTGAKKFNFSQKILLSIFPIIVTVFIFDTILFNKIPYEYYVTFWFILFVLMIIQSIILIIRILKLKMESGNKAFYVILIFSIIWFQLYYIWYLDDRYSR